MMTRGNPPSTNVANLDTLIGLLRTSFTKLMQGIDDALPATIVSYDPTTNRAVVQPMINVLTTQDQQIKRATIPNIPVYVYSGGGFIIKPPLNPGDKGFIKANDRDISLYLQSYEASKPNTYRIKSFSDAIFYPDLMEGYTISEDDASKLVMQSSDGTVKITLSNDTVTIVAPNVIIGGSSTNLTVDCNNLTINATGNINLDAGGAVNVTAATTVNIDSPLTNLGVGGLPIARLNDKVTVDITTGVGTISTTFGVNKSI